MKYLSLFTGIGGGDIGLQHILRWRAVGYVEFEPYCQKVIRQRIKDGYLTQAPIFGDVRAFLNEGYAGSYTGLVDVVTGGFPCQPFSLAGNQAGADDPRNMWPATLRVIQTVRPRACFLENVPGLVTSGYFGTILQGLAESGYNARWDCYAAANVGAVHIRERLWILAYTKHDDGKKFYRRSTKKKRDMEKCRSVRSFLDRFMEGLDREGKQCEDTIEDNLPSYLWRIDDGLADGLDRIKAIGNAQVPGVAANAWVLLSKGLC